MSCKVSDLTAAVIHTPDVPPGFQQLFFEAPNLKFVEVKGLSFDVSSKKVFVN